MAKWVKGQSGNPAGSKSLAQARADGWQNLTTGLGTARDKRMASEFGVDITDDQTARDLWLGNDIAARVVETIPQEALRAGYDVRIQADEDEDGADRGQTLETEEAMMDLNEDLGVEQLVEQAWKFERAYGGAAIFPIINDGSDDLTQPLDLDRLISLSHFVLLEPRECIPQTWQGDITQPNFGEPEIYSVIPITRGQLAQGMINVHHSRLIALKGIRTARYEMSVARPGWGGSVLQRCAEVIMDYQTAAASAAALMQDASQGVYKMAGFTKLLAANKAKTVQEQMAMMDTMRSVMRWLVIDAEDDFERKQTPLSGVPEILAKLESRLAAAADMPITLLMGMSPGGLNATGDSDRAFFYDRVARLQRIKLRPILEAIQRLIFRARMIGPEKDASPTNGTEPDVWSIQFRPLWQPSQQEEQQARWLQAQQDNVNIANGVLTPEEVATSRYGGDDYSFSTTIDMEARKAMADARSQMDVQPTAMPGQTTPEVEAAKKQAADTAAKAAQAGAKEPQGATKQDEMRLDYVEHVGSKWRVMSRKGKVLGEYDTEAEANERLRQIEAAKAAKGE
jgi:phage-related protein (TIGR01555 family)